MKQEKKSSMEEVREFYCPRCQRETVHLYSHTTDRGVVRKCTECKDTNSAGQRIYPFLIFLLIFVVIAIIRSLGFTYQSSVIIGATIALGIWIINAIIDRWKSRMKK